MRRGSCAGKRHTDLHGDAEIVGLPRELVQSFGDASETITSWRLACLISSPVTVRNSRLISALSPGFSSGSFVDEFAMPSRLPLASKALPLTLILPRGTSARFCTVPLI